MKCPGDSLLRSNSPPDTILRGACKLLGDRFIKQLHPFAHAQFATFNFVQRLSPKKCASDKTSPPGTVYLRCIQFLAASVSVHAVSDYTCRSINANLLYNLTALRLTTANIQTDQVVRNVALKMKQSLIQDKCWLFIKCKITQFCT